MKLDPVTGRKQCSRCKESLLPEKFSRDSTTPDGFSTQCKACKQIGINKWQQQNVEAKAAIHRRHKLKSNYGITLEDYNALLKRQGGLCAICQEECKTHAVLSVDHDHVSGRIRGLLCARCNQMIGLARDRTDILVSALRYLQTQ